MMNCDAGVSRNRVQTMPLLRPQRYVHAREAYSYEAPGCPFSIMQTGSLSSVGKYKGVFPKDVHPEYAKGINLRQFELICQEVFRDCANAMRNSSFANDHLHTLKSISAAVVCWKMWSQGGRGRVEYMLDHWSSDSARQLIKAFQRRDMSLFRIGGVGIATATAFMRFLFPDDFGVMDSRVVGNHTNPGGITTLTTRRNDGYITSSSSNARKYDEEYVPFLRSEASWLNAQDVTFQDVNATGQPFVSAFRACDIEMALFQHSWGAHRA